VTAVPDTGAPAAGGTPDSAEAPAYRADPPAAAGRGRGWRTPVGRLLVAGPALWLLFTAVHLVISGRVWWWRLFDLLPPLAFLVVPGLLALVAVPCRRSRRPAALLAAGALLLGAGLAGVNLTGALGGGAGPVPPGAIRVVAWNTEYWHEDGRADPFYALLRAQRADVYLLQEYLHHPAGEPVRIDEAERLRAAFPGYHVAVAGELVTLSAHPIVGRYPLTAPEAAAPPRDTDFPEYWRHKSLRTDLLVAGRVLSVYNVHVPTPVWVGGPSPVSAEFWDTVREQHDQRGPHLRALARDVAANDHPVLVAGDLNTTAAMGDRRRFPAGLDDAARVTRSPYPASWPAAGALPAWWRLDWALVSSEVAVHRYEFRDPAGLSDHRLQYLAVSL
jgi:endonuclease/exonuclease/phosphatase (EEP) superfamily protein YafD